MDGLDLVENGKKAGYPFGGILAPNHFLLFFAGEQSYMCTLT